MKKVDSTIARARARVCVCVGGGGGCAFIEYMLVSHSHTI